MSLRQLWSQQWFRVQKVAPIVNMGLLMATLALTVWRSVEWRGWPIHVAVPALVLALVALVVAGANVWVVLMRMHKTDRYASAIHDPTQVYALTHRESTIWLEATLPAMQAEISAWRTHGVDTAAWQAIHDRMERWARLGYIPITDAPEHVRAHYMGTHGEAL